MLYNSASEWRDSSHKRILFFGMSGLGKTHVSNMLRAQGDWFHYSIDYRIGTRYMGEYIADDAKSHAMKVPFLRDLLLSDSIYIGSNLTFDNLAPVAAYLGKPGNPALGGLAIDEYKRRQEQFRMAEVHALLDTEYFIDRAARLYDYPHFICDTGGSICEWVDGNNPDDPVLIELAKHTLLIWIKGDDAHTNDLIQRFDSNPKPMSYQPEFLNHAWESYLSKNNNLPGDVNPDDFIRWIYASALTHRQPRYEAMAKWGITVTADQIAGIKDPTSFDDLIAEQLAVVTSSKTAPHS